MYINILDNYKRLSPKDLSVGVTGFGYSFSNIGDGEQKNGKPYFAIGSVNTLSGESDAVLYYSSMLCINLRKKCKSTITAGGAVINEDDTGKLCAQKMNKIKLGSV